MKSEINVDQPYNLCLLSGYHPNKVGGYTKIEWLPKPIAISTNTFMNCVRTIRIELQVEKNKRDPLTNDGVSISTGDYIAIHRPKECFTDYTYTDCVIFYITSFSFDSCHSIDGVSTVIIHGKQVTNIADNDIFKKIHASDARRQYSEPGWEGFVENMERRLAVFNDNPFSKGATVSVIPVMPVITRVIINNPGVVVFWSDGDKTVGKCMENDEFNPEVGLSMAISRKYYKARGFPCPRAAFKKQIELAENQSDKTAERKKKKGDK